MNYAKNNASVRDWGVMSPNAKAAIITILIGGAVYVIAMDERLFRLVIVWLLGMILYAIVIKGEM